MNEPNDNTDAPAVEVAAEAFFAAEAEAGYRTFIAGLIPTLDTARIHGVRMPILRRYAQELTRAGAYETFLDALPHRSYEANLVHAILLAGQSEFSGAVTRVERFLPHVDNWAVCDAIRVPAFDRDPPRVVPHIERWIDNPAIYTRRFAIGQLLLNHLGEHFTADWLQRVAAIETDAYYLQMMIAWFLAEALVKQYDAAIGMLETRQLSPWLHAKTIQKAVESRRISEETKTYLRSLRRR